MVSIPRTVRSATCALLFAAAAAASRNVERADPNRLFVIRRSLNANIVVYDAVRDSQGNLDPTSPVKAYWLLNADKGERADLNLIEKVEAYGVEVGSSTKQSAQITVKALKDRPISVRIEGKRPEAIARISGQDALLRSVFVKTVPNHPRSVEYVELVGVSLRAHKPVRERIKTSG